VVSILETYFVVGDKRNPLVQAANKTAVPVFAVGKISLGRTFAKIYSHAIPFSMSGFTFPFWDKRGKKFSGA
jgi:hypothetical protein